VDYLVSETPEDHTRAQTEISLSLPAGKTSLHILEFCVLACSLEDYDLNVSELAREYACNVSRQAVEYAKKITCFFLEADTNGGGSLDIQELTTVLKNMYKDQKMSRSTKQITIEVQEAMKKWDVDNSGTLELGECICMYAIDESFQFKWCPAQNTMRQLLCSHGEVLIASSSRRHDAAQKVQGAIRGYDARAHTCEMRSSLYDESQSIIAGVMNGRVQRQSLQAVMEEVERLKVIYTASKEGEKMTCSELQLVLSQWFKPARQTSSKTNQFIMSKKTDKIMSAYAEPNSDPRVLGFGGFLVIIAEHKDEAFSFSKVSADVLSFVGAIGHGMENDVQLRLDSVTLIQGRIRGNKTREWSTEAVAKHEAAATIQGSARGAMDGRVSRERLALLESHSVAVLESAIKGSKTRRELGPKVSAMDILHAGCMGRNARMATQQEWEHIAGPSGDAAIIQAFVVGSKSRSIARNDLDDLHLTSITTLQASIRGLDDRGIMRLFRKETEKAASQRLKGSLARKSKKRDVEYQLDVLNTSSAMRIQGLVKAGGDKKVVLAERGETELYAKAILQAYVHGYIDKEMVSSQREETDAIAEAIIQAAVKGYADKEMIMGLRHETEVAAKASIQASVKGYVDKSKMSTELKDTEEDAVAILQASFKATADKVVVGALRSETEAIAEAIIQASMRRYADKGTVSQERKEAEVIAHAILQASLKGCVDKGMVNSERSSLETDAQAVLQGSVKAYTNKQEVMRERKETEEDALALLQASLHLNVDKKKVQAMLSEANEDAVAVLQASVKGHNDKAMVNEQRRISEDDASATLQASVRGYATKGSVIDQRKETEAIAQAILQASVRGYADKETVMAQHIASGDIAQAILHACVKRYAASSAVKSQRSENEADAAIVLGASVRGSSDLRRVMEERTEAENEAQAMLQGCVRGHSVRNSVTRQKDSRAIIQGSFQGYLDKGMVSDQRATTEKNAEAVMQGFTKGYDDRQKVRSEVTGIEAAALSILQGSARGYSARRIALELGSQSDKDYKEAILFIQNGIRQWQWRMQVKAQVTALSSRRRRPPIAKKPTSQPVVERQV